MGRGHGSAFFNLVLLVSKAQPREEYILLCYLTLCGCACIVCMCVLVCACEHTHMCRCWHQRSTLGVFLISLYTCLRQVLSLNIVSTICPVNAWDLFVSAPTCTPTLWYRYKPPHTDFHMSAGIHTQVFKPLLQSSVTGMSSYSNISKVYLVGNTR